MATAFPEPNEYIGGIVNTTTGSDHSTTGGTPLALGIPVQPCPAFEDTVQQINIDDGIQRNERKDEGSSCRKCVSNPGSRAGNQD